MPELRVNGHRVFYSAAGGGEPVILLHAGGSNERQWKSLSSELEDRYLCLAPDLPGHGASPRWLGADGSRLADHAAIVEALAHEVGGRFHLVGHSHGGAVAAAYATRHSQTLLSLTLIEPTLMHLLQLCGRREVWDEAETLGIKHINAVSNGRLDEIADEFMPYWIGQDAWLRMPEDRRAAIIATMPSVAQFWASVLAETTLARGYAKIQVPSLLVRGSRTRATTHDLIEILSGLLSHSRIVEIEGAGHMAPLTHAAQVNEAIERHIRRHSADG